MSSLKNIPDDITPVSRKHLNIVTGFLGSGKTSLILNYLKSNQNQNEKTIVRKLTFQKICSKSQKEMTLIVSLLNLQALLGKRSMSPRGVSFSFRVV
jgi:predicted ATPase